MLTTILALTGGLLYFSWNLAVGHELYQLATKHAQLNYNLFLINAFHFVWMPSYIAVAIFSNGQRISSTGVAALIGFYMLYAGINHTAFPAKALKSIEQNKTARLGDYIGEFFLILFSPIGVWVLQPRLNRIAERLDGESE